MRTRLIDRNNDFTFGLQQSGYARGINSCALDCKLKLQEWYGDCFFALQNGIAWNVRLGTRGQKELLDADIQRVAAQADGVLAITDFESEVYDRRYRCSFNVMQQYTNELLPMEFVMRI